MSGALRIAKTHLVTALRERITLFWFLIFPVFMLVLLTVIFGRLGEPDAMQFTISFVNLDLDASGPLASLVPSALRAASTPGEDGGGALFVLREPGPDEDPQTFLEEETVQLRRGHRAALVVVPRGFAATLEDSLTDPQHALPLPLELRYSAGGTASEMATAILEQMLAGIDRELHRMAGSLDPGAVPAVENVLVGGGETAPSYVDFLLPGVILMGFFTNGLFGIPGSILFARDRKVLRRYWVTPLDVTRYLAGLSLGHLTLCVLQFVLLFVIGRFALGARIGFAHPASIGTLALAAVTFMSLGFLIASFARTGNAGMAIANVLNMPMMFLSGLFFPISGMPTALKVIVRINPVTYLAEGLRASVGVEQASMSAALLVGVPLAWIVCTAVIASRRLRWDVTR